MSSVVSSCRHPRFVTCPAIFTHCQGHPKVSTANSARFSIAPPSATSAAMPTHLELAPGPPRSLRAPTAAWTLPSSLPQMTTLSPELPLLLSQCS